MKINQLSQTAMAIVMAAFFLLSTTNISGAMTRVEINTTAGRMVIGLYDDTPLHRDNFVKLVKEGYYDGLLFHRVINEFMIQTGDPDSRNAPAGKQLGAGNPGYEIDAEILCPTHINRRGALAAARTGDAVNPQRRSSGSQFYIVTGRTFTDQQLDQMQHQARMGQKQEIFNRLASEHRDSIMAMRRNRDQAGLQALQDSLVKQTEEMAAANPFTYTEEQREIYRTQGGAPHLDGAYTVFGEVLEGMDTVAKIEKAETDPADRPKEDIRIISMKILEK